MQLRVTVHRSPACPREHGAPTYVFSPLANAIALVFATMRDVPCARRAPCGGSAPLPTSFVFRVVVPDPAPKSAASARRVCARGSARWVARRRAGGSWRGGPSCRPARTRACPHATPTRADVNRGRARVYDVARCRRVPWATSQEAGKPVGLWLAPVAAAGRGWEGGLLRSGAARKGQGCEGKGSHHSSSPTAAASQENVGRFPRPSRNAASTSPTLSMIALISTSTSASV